ncbi:hypothetical protein [Paenibacillus qinlingensis]|uniref:Uncharacterized protein n=1 Tax=Paenibacillus qinlingensis TaxID=1837343 RepID=A0ABU1NTH4_9BACL|nr:hypothetical protein [Paenibacillus qinlingensis]MDR6550779.1 hypothetical protein [Paenibacillus qinlingensis]
MLEQISDYLFMGSLIFLVITVFLFSSGSNFFNTWNTTGAATDLQMNHDHTKMVNAQHSRLVKLFKSYLFWIPVTGMIASVVLSNI